MKTSDGLEALRLQELLDYQIIDTSPESKFDSITMLASYICNAPISLVSLLDNERQWFKSKHGLEVSETPRNISFCNYTIQTDEIFEVENALNDKRFANNPLVQGYPNIQFYAGAPLITPDGYRLGSLCVIDSKPNKLDDRQKIALKILASEVMSHMELAKKNRRLEKTLTDYQDIYAMFDASGELHCILDEKGKIESINKAVFKILGYTVNEAIGRNMWDFCHQHDIPYLVKQIESELRSGNKNLELEIRVMAKDGSVKWIGWTIAVKDRKWFANGRDITFQKQIITDLEQLSMVASKIENGVIISDCNNQVIWANTGFENITGYNLEDLKGHQLGDILKGEATDESIIALARERLKNKRSYAVELLVYRKSGEPVWLSIMNSIILNSTGEIDRHIEIITDITAKKEADQQLDILSIAARKSSSGIIVRNNKGEILWINEALESILGYTLQEAIGKKVGEFLVGEETDMATFRSAQQAVIEKRPYTIELQVYGKNAKPIWVFISNNPILNNEGDVERQVGIVVDVTERKKAEEELTLLSLVASKTVNGVVISDAEGKVKWINDSFEILTGFTLADLKGKRVGDMMIGKETNLDELARVRALAEKTQPFNTELLNYKKDGTPVWVSVSNTPIFNKDGSVEQEIEIINDISERKRAEENLIKTREEALQLSKAKEMFLSVMSHEIRTPLNAVIGMTHILLDDNPTESQLENLNILKFSAENLHSLLNDILDFTKIETNNLQLERVDVNLKHLVSHTMNSLQFKTAEKGIALKSEIDYRIPQFVKGDNTRLYQILINLLGNSIKFTECGEVKLKLNVVNQDKDNITINFEVSDTGIGIGQDKLSFIFDAYRQAETNTSRKYGGTGLGLAITKKLIEMHNSEIIVTSEKGKGSSFMFTIKFATSTPAEMLPLKGASYRTFSSSVLVVDDNEINRLLAKKVLFKWGITADFAENGKIALDMVQQKRYDLILMDIQMPVMGGMEAVKLIRQLEGNHFKDLTIIALTASIMSNDVNDIKSSGMNDYVLKPFVPDELYAKLNLYL